MPLRSRNDDPCRRLNSSIASLFRRSTRNAAGVSAIVRKGRPGEAGIGEHTNDLGAAEHVRSQSAAAFDVGAANTAGNGALDGRRATGPKHLEADTERCGTETWNLGRRPVGLNERVEWLFQRKQRGGRAFVAKHPGVRLLRECQVAQEPANHCIQVYSFCGFRAERIDPLRGGVPGRTRYLGHWEFVNAWAHSLQTTQASASQVCRRIGARSVSELPQRGHGGVIWMDGGETGLRAAGGMTRELGDAIAALR